MPVPNSNTSGALPRIQISLGKDQRKNMASASQEKSNSDSIANSKKAVHSGDVANAALYKSVRKALKNQSLNFKINVECKYRNILWLYLMKEILLHFNGKTLLPFCIALV